MFTRGSQNLNPAHFQPRFLKAPIDASSPLLVYRHLGINNLIGFGKSSMNACFVVQSLEYSMRISDDAYLKIVQNRHGRKP